MMNPKDIDGVKQLLASPKKIVIIPHRNPDGDAMGSTLGLYHFLKQKGHDPLVMIPNEAPDFLAWLPSFDTVKVFEKESEAATKMLEAAELVFTLDFNVLSRTGDQMEAVLQNLKVPFIMIDHHQKPGDYALHTFSDTSFGSTCEMIYHFIVAMGEKSLIDKTIATCLYTGIVTDSGSFRYPLTTGTTHRVVADFIDLGIDNTAIHSLLFDNHSHNRILILARALQNMKVLPAYKTSYTSLSQEELNSFGHAKGDTEGIVNYGLSMKDIAFTAFFTENKDEGIIKISFRSKGNFDVNQYAREHFSGGGHINAAGGKSTESLEATIQKFIATLAHTKID
ncbi:DHH family phosphoesterase [Flavobacterium sp. AG291]|uniref:DHH family phosphoesterase n=1 Tax=Flavobacterium sp. AG291 TaxID=2184000 RepID=UPI000E0A68FF|nr:bifunctional oligoribonuclease/PAP phosphatase NrnA [Flavobacterium sp. AG291]RDI06959.1 phosphoesterase RecJ-like protein [Flavobacterium sp. AG291]